jgi:cAMP-dependent protein kinase regulator
MDEKNLNAGEVIITEGLNGDELYVVEQGKLACSKVINGSEQHLKNYEAGDVFGELALLYNAPRAATIKAVEGSQLWVLDRNTFNHIVKDASQKKRQKYENFLSTVPILQNMDHYERSKIADAIKEIKQKKGDVIIKQGEQGDLFYIIIEGEAHAMIEGKQEAVMKYTSGAYFGELALLRGDPRAATVIAQTDCKLI